MIWPASGRLLCSFLGIGVSFGNQGAVKIFYMATQRGSLRERAASRSTTSQPGPIDTEAEPRLR